MTASSTLVETVSINFEDFNESFLTCGTCLCMYDGSEHTPKLLPCSHTVCRQCLERIVASATLQSREAGTFRCPICRETITLPRGGVSALPPSFLVNQLLDLMLRQRREVIPKCSQHPSQELLFCETCDSVFCTLCTAGMHGNGTGSAGEHTVIPFSIAIKRMSEILLYKAHQCIGQLSSAADAVTEEMHRLEHNANAAFEEVNRSFQEAMNHVEKRRVEMMAQVKNTRDEKKKVLSEQLALIQAERECVEGECEGLQYQVEVRNITKKISELSAKLDSVGSLKEPRENAFMLYDSGHNESLTKLQTALDAMGRVSVSKTFPALCTAELDPVTMHLETKATVTTVDYHGIPRASGGDPLSVELRRESGDPCPVHVKDNDDGTYELYYKPSAPGLYCLRVMIFDRPIKGSPFHFEVSSHIEPVWTVGGRGSGPSHFLQPASVAVDRDGLIYVADTGNSRVRVVNSHGQNVRILESQGLEERGGTGVATTPNNTLIVVNWRSRYVTELCRDGQFIGQFTHPDFMEPIAVAVNSKGEVLVADNGPRCVFVFDHDGMLIRALGARGSPVSFGLIVAVAVGKDDDILVADTQVRIFSRGGQLIREIGSDSKGKYGGVAFDGNDLILATHSTKGMAGVHVFSYEGQMRFVIDSHGAKLKRPSGVATTTDGHIIVVDLGNDCVKKFRYR